VCGMTSNTFVGPGARKTYRLEQPDRGSEPRGDVPEFIAIAEALKVEPDAQSTQPVTDLKSTVGDR
jgi:hypothetical protein